MSKGLGHVGRAIAAVFDAEPDNAFTTGELCERAYPDEREWVAERSKRVAVLRAVKGLAVHRPDLGLEARKADMTRGKPAVFYRQYRVLSYAMARLKGDIFSFKHWKPEAELRAEIAEGGRHHQHVISGGAWLRHTEMAIARRDGDTVALERLAAEQERAMEGSALRIAAALPSKG
jgi:hypothetical protein